MCDSVCVRARKGEREGLREREREVGDCVNVKESHTQRARIKLCLCIFA